MVTDRKLGFIGVGNMGEALVKGLIATKAATPAQILVSARRRERIQEMEKSYGVRGGTNAEVARQSDVVVLAVKPQILDEVLTEISGDVSRDELTKLLGEVRLAPEGASEERIEEVEQQMDCKLPRDVKAFLRQHDGGEGTIGPRKRPIELWSLDRIRSEC